MKLIVCRRCGDVVKLTGDLRRCQCRESAGRYLDEHYAEIAGPCVPIGISAESLEAAVRSRPRTGLGVQFRAYVMPLEVSAIRELTAEPPRIPALGDYLS